MRRRRGEADVLPTPPEHEKIEIECPSCTAEIEFDPAVLEASCPFCGAAVSLEDGGKALREISDFETQRLILERRRTESMRHRNAEMETSAWQDANLRDPEKPWALLIPLLVTTALGVALMLALHTLA